MRRFFWENKWSLTNRSRSRLWPALALFFFALAAVSSIAATATFTATLDRDTVTVGESAILTLRFDGAEPKNFPAIPGIANLQVASQENSRNVNIINGQVSYTLTQNFALTPTQPGEYTIPALQAEVNGQMLTSQPLKLKAVPADAEAARNAGEQLAFVRLMIPKKEMYVGEVIEVQLQLYIRNGVANVSDFQFQLNPDGFNTSKLTEGQHFQQTVGSVSYTVIPLWATLTAARDGALKIGPFNGSVVVHVQGSRQRQVNPFDMESFFGPRTEPKSVALSVPMQDMQVLPLPKENLPANFNGAVGKYVMTFSAGPTNVAAGDPITVKIQVSGQGQLDALTLPDQPAWHDFKTYSATAHTEARDPFGLQGTKFFEQVVVPQNSDIKTLPSPSFSYFDPDQKKYYTITQPAVPLVVHASKSAPAPTLLAGAQASRENPPPSQDIVSIKQRPGTLAEAGPPLVQQAWFLGLQSVPVLALLCAFVWRKRNERLANNPRLRRRRLVAQVVHEGLNDLQRIAAGNNSDEFFAVLFHLMQEQLGERLDLPASAITEAVIEERLRPGGVAEGLLQSLHEFFQMCNLARYAPVKSSQELAAVIPRFESVLRELQKIYL
jgi:oxygen tolerance protein BatD